MPRIVDQQAVSLHTQIPALSPCDPLVAAVNGSGHAIYGLKLFLYASVWCIAGALMGFRWMSDLNFFIVFGSALLIAVATVLTGRWFRRKTL